MPVRMGIGHVSTNEYEYSISAIANSPNRSKAVV